VHDEQRRKKKLTSHRNLDSELGVAEHGEHGGDSRQRVRDDDGRPCCSVGFLSCDDEDARPDDGTHAEPHEIPPGERPLHGDSAATLDLYLLLHIRSS